MHHNQLFVYLLLGIVSSVVGAPVSSNVIASSELTKGITQSANVESGSDLVVRTIGALSHPTRRILPVDSHSVMEARSRAINADRDNVSSDEDWEGINHPEAPGQPTESTAAVHPEPPRTDAKVPEQKPKDPEPKTRLVPLLSYTWVGSSADSRYKRVSPHDLLIHQEAVALVEKAAKSIWKLKSWHRHNSFMYPVTHSHSIETAEFKFILKLEYDGAKGENYCEGRVEGESDDGYIGIIRWGYDESGNHRISELRNKDGVVAQISSM